MTASHRSRNYLLLTYLLLSLVPLFPWCLGREVENWWQILLLEAVLWLVLWAAAKRPAYFHWLLLPVFLMTPVEIYLQLYYQQGISTHHLGVIADTSVRETLEFLGWRVWLVAALLLLMLAWFALSWWLAWRSKAMLINEKVRGVIMLLCFFVAMNSLYGSYFGVEAEPASEKKASSGIQMNAAMRSHTNDNPQVKLPSVRVKESPWPMLPAWAQFSFPEHIINRSWPFGLVAHGIDYWAERKYLMDLTSENNGFSFGARHASSFQGPQVVVLVVGESSRFDRWSLNGYQRETNPLLQKTENLISLQNFITPVTATRLSLPVILTRKVASQSLFDHSKEKSFLSAFKEAGFKTWWMSTQNSIGFYETPVSVFAREADVVQYMNPGGIHTTSNYDEILLGTLQAALADKSEKKLIVLHTMGSHWNFHLRYPKAFERWTPALHSDQQTLDMSLKTELNNSYDNTILYTDWVLAKVIEQLRDSKKVAAMMYVSDHGEVLFDGECKQGFHGHNSQFEFHVPALFWYSDAYQQTYPAKVAQLKQRQNTGLSTENIFHSLLDTVDIRYPDERIARSFLSERFQSQQRLVDSFGWVDYDQAEVIGACRQVMPKKKVPKK